MKFVFFGYDFSVNVLQRLIADGHELIGVFTFECDGIFNFNNDVLSLAKQAGASHSFVRPEEGHLKPFYEMGCEALISVGYPYKIPYEEGVHNSDAKKIFGINLHPSYLPFGRGLMPVPTILMSEPKAAGITIHKLSDDFDAGDVLLQENFDLNLDEDVETYSARIAMKSPDMMSEVIANIGQFWEKARPQDHDKASVFTPPTEDMRRLDWEAGIEQIDKVARAFGRYGSLAEFSNARWAVYEMKCWRERHNHAPGKVVCHLSREIVIAASDGYVCLKQFQKLDG